MENLIFSLNATIPIFLMMVLGVFFRKTGLLKENMINGLNQFVFKATLPEIQMELVARMLWILPEIRAQRPIP